MVARVFFLIITFTVIGCSGKKKVEREEYPDFSEEQKKPSPKTFHTVEIQQMKFVPEVLHLHAGDTVKWINNDITDHDVTEEINKSWTSSKLSMGQSWQRVITKSDEYYCSIHVVMKGKLVVE